MLPTNRTAAHTPQSTLDYQSLANREHSLPPTLSGFLDLLGPTVRTDPAPAAQALSTVIRQLQAGAAEGPSMRLWLLVAYAPGLQALATRSTRDIRGAYFLTRELHDLRRRQVLDQGEDDGRAARIRARNALRRAFEDARLCEEATRREHQIDLSWRTFRLIHPLTPAGD